MNADIPAAGYDVLAGGGEMGALMRAHDWSATPVGPPQRWPQSLRITVRLVLTSRHPMLIWWGPELVQFYNDAYRATLGPDRHPAALGQQGQACWGEIWDLVGPQIAQVMAGGDATWHEEQRVPATRDGRREDRWWTYGYSPINDPAAANGVGGVLVICNDVTHGHLAREALRRSEERTRHALAASNGIGTWDWNVGDDLVYADRNFARIYGVDPEQAAAGVEIALFTRNIHPDDKPRVEAAITQAIEFEADFASEYRLIQTDGSMRWVAASGRPIRAALGQALHFPGVTIDITDRKNTEAQLRELNENLVRLVDEREKDLRDSQDFAKLALAAVSGVGAWTFDMASDCFVCDEAISELYGIDARQAQAGIIRSAFLANVHPDDAAQLQVTMADALVRSGDVELEYRIRHPDGSTRWVLSRGHTYMDGSGKAVRRTGVGIDMTKQRLLEEQLRQSQKMEAIGQLTGGLAHDFNNLLMGISGSLELIQMRLKQGRVDELDKYISVAQGASKRAAALTHRLLAFSRRQTLDPKPTDANLLIANMQELIGRTVGPGVQIEVAAAAGLWVTLIDPSQLESALLNLCINARDAMPGGGRIRVATANLSFDENSARELEVRPGQYISVSVSDTGCGMTAEVIARAFDPFFTTKPIGQGTGLGLSMIYGFALQSGGQVRIKSTAGTGTTMSVYLPRYEGDTAGAPAGEDFSVTPAEHGETVLVVDDEAAVRMLIVEVLEGLGYIAIEAADGAAGLRVLQSRARIDLLVTDVGLPGGLNGRQVADAGRALRPGLKVLFVTGYAEHALLGTDYSEAGMALITKPFAIDALANRIQALILEG